MKKDDDQIISEDSKPKADSDDELMNLNNELYSLTHYADDEEELVAQMFSSIKGSKLEAMMPPILREIPSIEVQQLCLHELRGMSQRRILSIINGQELSESSTEDESEEESKGAKGHDGNEDSNMSATKAMLAEAERALENGDEAANLTAMDLLELEMRAKLIKTMLEKQEIKQEPKSDDDVKYDPNKKIKKEPVTPERRSRRYSSSRSSSYSSSYSSSRSKSGSSSSRSSSGRRVRRRSKEKLSKKLTKKEFEDRMKKAKMNRRYRGRKSSDNDSGKEKSQRKSKQIEDTTEETNTPMDAVVQGSENLPETEMEQDVPNEEGEEPKEDEEGEVLEKEEGELDSNEDFSTDEFGRVKRRPKKKDDDTTRSRSKSYSNDDSQERSPSRRSRKKKKKSRRRRRRSPSETEQPKIPNWKSDEDSSKLPVKSIKETVTIEDDDFAPKETVEDLDASSKVIRQSISFAINKKLAPGKANPDLDDDDRVPETEGDENITERNLSRMSLNSLKDPEMEDSNDAERGRDDFYKGSEMLPDDEVEEGEESDVPEYEDDEYLVAGGKKSTKTIQKPPDVSQENSQDMEIIGTIEPKDLDEVADTNQGEADSSWSMRWLQSEKVQKVVSNSKMLSKVRKNIQAKGKKGSNELPKMTFPKELSEKFAIKSQKTGPIGSLEEYEKTVGIRVKAPTHLPTAKVPQPKPAPAPTPVVKPVVPGLLDSGDDDDSEDDAIWSKIMNK